MCQWNFRFFCAELFKSNHIWYLITWNGPNGGAFEQLFGPGREEFEQKFSKNSNAQGVAQGGGGDVEALIWLVHYSDKCLCLASEKFVLASESNLSLATGLASWKVSLEPWLSWYYFFFSHTSYNLWESSLFPTLCLPLIEFIHPLLWGFPIPALVPLQSLSMTWKWYLKLF